MKLTHHQQRIAAAILGVSNAGADSLFRGRHAEIGADHIRSLLKQNDGINTLTARLVRSIVETDEQLEMFQDEVRSWQPKMKNETIESLSAVHKDYAHLFEALRG